MGAVRGVLRLCPDAAPSRRIRQPQSDARMTGVKIKWDRDADAAYISLIPDEERVYGVAQDSVTLDDVAEDTGIGALHSLVLDFDCDGKLIGIEVLAPRATLRDSTLRGAM